MIHPASRVSAADHMTSPTGIGHLNVANGEPLVWGRRTYVMGIINVTPDSFSGDGLAQDGLESSEETVAAALRKGLEFQEAGADFLDIGAESTRPGNQPIPAQEELDRLMPPLEALARNLTIPIAVDTYKSSVAREALRAGASIVNDVWGLKQDPALASVTAEAGGFLVVMHNQERAIYRDLLPDILESLKESCNTPRRPGFPRRKSSWTRESGSAKPPSRTWKFSEDWMSSRRRDSPCWWASRGSPPLAGCCTVRWNNGSTAPRRR